MRYFAYGSNLDARDWQDHCVAHGFDPGSLREIGPALMPDMSLCFDYRSAKRGAGAANVTPNVGHAVFGALFDVSDDGWRALDVKEGVAHGRYARTVRCVIRPDGRLERVHTYEVTPGARGAFCAPNAHYEAIVRAGLAARGWPVETLSRAARGLAPVSAIDGLFVYGTLMRGECRFPAIGASVLREVHAASAAGTLHETGHDFPAMRLPADDSGGDAHARVHGEFMTLDDLPSRLPALDGVEEFAGYDDPAPMYWRTVVPVDLAGAGRRLAWVYTAADPSLARARIDSGDWRAFTGRAAPT